MKFPEGFLWGVATSSYQIEGAVHEDGRGPSIWDTFSHTPGRVLHGHTGDVACDHYHRWPEDLELLKQLGVKAYRFSFAWPRLIPAGTGAREPRGFAFYDRLIEGLLEAGIEPVATVYHWDLPQPLQDHGGWASRSMLDAFEGYARALGEHFGDRVKRWSPINEPWVVSWLGYGTGVHAPGIADTAQAIAAAHHTVAAHNRAARALHEVVPQALVGPVLNQAHPAVDDISDPFQMRVAAVQDMNQNTFWMQALLTGEYPELAYEIYGDRLTSVVHPGDLDVQPMEWLGINFYHNFRIGHQVPVDHPTRNTVIDSLMGAAAEGAPVGPTTDMGWPITPQGIGDLLVRWTREYPGLVPQMFITENGVAYDDGVSDDGQVHDLRRIEYLRSHISSVGDAMQRGANVGGYYEWSLMDNFEWAVGYDKRFGIIHVDYETQKRTLKDSALWYRDVIRNNEI
ncbi:MAG: GH1 family beta-glucosidase [Candidatus Nanopelagicales bacterium]